MNSTNIVLIPKTQGLESIGSYHPIGLCNLVYKIVSKILVGRIRPLLDQLISPYQTAFVPSRRGVDNAIVMQEIIHTMGRTKGKCGDIALKIDLEKAYDKLEWGFIRGMWRPSTHQPFPALVYHVLWMNAGTWLLEFPR